jgi:RHS repeat-associated protein
VVTNLRLPGQYDERVFAAAGISGLQGPYQNWHRWYLPTIGRYMELDPIALHGGFNGPFGPNWYGYAEGNPLRWTDEEGLATWMCTKPLDALGGGPGKKNYTDWINNPLFHQYICTDMNGRLDLPVCGGKQSTNGEWRGPGTPSNDSYSADRCEKIPTNKCFEKCVIRKIEDPGNRGWYNLFTSNCQHWANQVERECTSECGWRSRP